MSNFISIVSTAFNTNLIDEAREARNSFNIIYKKWPATEVDLAKVVAFAAKIFGTIFLAFLAKDTFTILKRRTASLGQLFFAASIFFLASDLLQVRNNLCFQYTMTQDQKIAHLSTESQKGWGPFGSALSRLGKSTFDQWKAKTMEQCMIKNPQRIEEFRAERVAKVAVQNTYIFYPLFQATIHPQ